MHPGPRRMLNHVPLVERHWKPCGVQTPLHGIVRHTLEGVSRVHHDRRRCMVMGPSVSGELHSDGIAIHSLALCCRFGLDCIVDRDRIHKAVAVLHNNRPDSAVLSEQAHDLFLRRARAEVGHVEFRRGAQVAHVVPNDHVSVISTKWAPRVRVERLALPAREPVQCIIDRDVGAVQIRPLELFLGGSSCLWVRGVHKAVPILHHYIGHLTLFSEEDHDLLLGCRRWVSGHVQVLRNLCWSLPLHGTSVASIPCKIHFNCTAFQNERPLEEPFCGHGTLHRVGVHETVAIFHGHLKHLALWSKGRADVLHRGFRAIASDMQVPRGNKRPRMHRTRSTEWPVWLAEQEGQLAGVAPHALLHGKVQYDGLAPHVGAFQVALGLHCPDD
mmetsp:Transcript_27949/g.81819  ORF Transcript_27949/g.81819 Transcript_27949/m.81819 type:complete len:386 (+) Transcript_27949:325-1482(+)